MRIPFRIALIAGGLAAAGALISQTTAPGRVGPTADGGFLMNTGWLLKPAGRQVQLQTLPMASAVSPGGKYLVILQAGSQPPSVSLHEPGSLKELDRLVLPDAWLGLAFAPVGDVFYVSGGATATVMEIAISHQAKLELRRTFTVVPAENRKATDLIGDVTLSPNGRLVYAAAVLRNSIFVINPQSGMVIEEWKTAHRPYRILFHPDGRSFYVTGWGDGSLYHHNAESGEILARYSVGLQPMDMVWRDKAPEADPGEDPPQYKARLFVAVAGSNHVAVFGVNADKSMFRVDSISGVTASNSQPSGMTPSALAVSPDGNTLYVVCSDSNAVSRVAIAGKRGMVEGLIPTGAYPTSARVLPDGQLLVLNGRTPQGGGSASIIPNPTPEQMDDFAQTVERGSTYRPQDELRNPFPMGHALFRNESVKAPIDHVIYVLKEGLTYDEVLGDINTGNGDAARTIYGEDVTPNHHKLAREYVLLDNFYVSGDTSAAGLSWSVAGIAPPFLQLLAPGQEAGRYKLNALEGVERAAVPSAGYLWSNAMQRGVKVRNYGLWVNNIEPAPKSDLQVSGVKDPSLAQVTNRMYRGADLDYKDTDRVKVFLSDLSQAESTGNWSQLTVVGLSNDRTSGSEPKKIAPKAAVADNDAALGALVAGVSRSRFWSSTAIFVVETSTRGGADHVDRHRAPALVISPYTKNRGTDSTFYNTMSLLRSIEAVLGVTPMTMHDAGGRVLRAPFLSSPDTAAYGAVQPRQNLEERNP
ncbi:bifunctional YncE family protein/alkaline phosphatase family protein [uncultured Paludibaculum sp.]|uniref:bifunctional YncE family protein/alkaline phosphatase family protein n=1 Tax=uncultured Paludibaculum sp. TaxID=1765020 RepID=UPI002AAB584D|nr:bifunctional YncE family protein/alkaline phosphatase family protein [uncultured Paludibaculum sp.]